MARNCSSCGRANEDGVGRLARLRGERESGGRRAGRCYAANARRTWLRPSSIGAAAAGGAPAGGLGAALREAAARKPQDADALRRPGGRRLRDEGRASRLVAAAVGARAGRAGGSSREGFFTLNASHFVVAAACASVLAIAVCARQAPFWASACSHTGSLGGDGRGARRRHALADVPAGGGGARPNGELTGGGRAAGRPAHREACPHRVAARARGGGGREAERHRAPPQPPSAAAETRAGARVVARPPGARVVARPPGARLSAATIRARWSRRRRPAVP